MMLLSAQPQPPATLSIIRLLLRSRQPHIYFNCRVFFPQATSHYTDRMIGMLSAPFWKWASVREGPPVDSSTTRSENQAKLQTSGRTKTAVVQCCSAAVLQEQEPSPLSAIRPSCGQLAALFCPLQCCRSWVIITLQHNLWIGWRLETHVLGYLSVSAQHQTHHILPWRVQCAVVAR